MPLEWTEERYTWESGRASKHEPPLYVVDKRDMRVETYPGPDSDSPPESFPTVREAKAWCERHHEANEGISR